VKSDDTPSLLPDKASRSVPFRRRMGRDHHRQNLGAIIGDLNDLPLRAGTRSFDEFGNPKEIHPRQRESEVRVREERARDLRTS